MFGFPVIGKDGCSKGQFLPHPTSCTKYLRCQWNAYETQTCSVGLHWNQVSLDILICYPYDQV